MAGALFVVATPIGNLEDLTFRALRTLQEVDFIAAEDTRRTSKLLAHYQIQKPLVSLHEHNEVRETPRLVARIAGGATAALVSDAGTPGIADPGTRLVRAIRDAGLRVVPIPGASAIATALSVSGFPASQFVFLGFPPASGTERAAWFKVLSDERRTSVFFEAPHRIQKTLTDLRNLLVKRHIIIAREITKIHEEFIEQPINTETAQELVKIKGEFTVVVGADPGDGSAWLAREEVDSDEVNRIFGLITNTERPDRDTAIGILAMCFRTDRAVVKKIIKKHIMSGK